MKATDILKHEHRVIEQVLDCLEAICNQCEADHRLDAESAGMAIDFFRNFADGCHHRKEEDCLFPMMESRGFSRETGPTGVMLAEHEQARRLIQNMADALDASEKPNQHARSQFADNARGYIQLLREHIHKEDDCLFRMADATLHDEDQQSLLANFDLVEHGKTAGTHEHYLQIAHELGRRFGVGGPDCCSPSCCAAPHKS